MGELAKRVTGIAASTVGNTVNPIVTGLLTTAAVVTRNPELAVFSIPAGALAGVLGEQGLLLVNQTLHDRAERVQQLTEAIEDETGRSAEEFISEHINDGAKRDLLGHVVDVAATARSAWKIRVLAQAFVHGAKDADLIDETLMFVGLVQDLIPGHARLLAAIGQTAGDSTFDGHPVSSSDLILAVDPGLRAALPFLVRRLMELDLVTRPEAGATGRVALTDLGRGCADWLSSLGASGG